MNEQPKEFTLDDMRMAFYAGQRRGTEIGVDIALKRYPVTPQSLSFVDWLKDYLSIDKSTAITNDRDW